MLTSLYTVWCERKREGFISSSTAASVCCVDCFIVTASNNRCKKGNIFLNQQSIQWWDTPLPSPSESKINYWRQLWRRKGVPHKLPMAPEHVGGMRESILNFIIIKSFIFTHSQGKIKILKKYILKIYLHFTSAFPPFREFRRKHKNATESLE